MARHLTLPPPDQHFTIELRKARAYARLAYWFEPLHWVLTDIYVPEPHQRNGIGSTLLQRVVRYADAQRIDLCLSVQPAGGWMSHDDLVEWYGRYGFVWTDGIMKRNHGTGESMTQQDNIIRNYLKAQEDPNSLIDHARVNELQALLDAEADPIVRLKLSSEIERLNTPPIDDVRRAFIENVDSWAKDNGVSVAALVAEGASADDLKEAGLIEGPAPAKETHTDTSSTNGSTKAKRGTQKDVIQHIKRTRKPFTAPQIVQATKVSRSTAAAAINKLLAEGVVKDTGEEESSKRGRAAKVYVYDRD